MLPRLHISIRRFGDSHRNPLFMGGLHPQLVSHFVPGFVGVLWRSLTALFV